MGFVSPRVWNYGNASFDQTHNFVFNYTSDLPKGSRPWSNRPPRMAQASLGFTF
jgi:hypothetical protein